MTGFCAAALFCVVLALGVCAMAAEDYNSWMAAHAKADLGRGWLGEREAERPLKLVITKFTEPDPPKPGSLPNHSWGEGISGIEMTDDNRIIDFRRSSFSEVNGGGSAALPAPIITHLEELLAALPQDGGRLPPRRRRVLIQAKLGEHSITRLYDCAQAPAAAWEVMRICKSDIGMVVPEFKPQSTIDTGSRGSSGGFLRLTPDGRQLLFTTSYMPLQFWDPVSHELLRELRDLGGGGIAFSPDGARAVLPAPSGSVILDTRTWERTPQKFPCGQTYFTRDGGHLVQDGWSGRFSYPMKIWETATWAQIVQLDEVPAEAISFRPAAKRPLAVVVTKTGAVTLWNTEAHREIAILREDGKITEVAFSPDESLVAISTQGENGFDSGYGIWRTADGSLLHELHPFERGPHLPSRGLVWTPDGAYLLAGAYPEWYSTSSVCLFNVQTGRHEAEFSGPRRITGVVVLPDATQLVAGDEEGKIYFWDLPKALREAREFQQALPAL